MERVRRSFSPNHPHPPLEVTTDTLRHPRRGPGMFGLPTGDGRLAWSSMKRGRHSVLIASVLIASGLIASGVPPTLHRRKARSGTSPHDLPSPPGPAATHAHRPPAQTSPTLARTIGEMPLTGLSASSRPRQVADLGELPPTDASPFGRECLPKRTATWWLTIADQWSKLR
jgi:hypothetical protein